MPQYHSSLSFFFSLSISVVSWIFFLVPIKNFLTFAFCIFPDSFCDQQVFQPPKNIDLGSLGVESNRYRIEHQDQSNPHVAAVAKENPRER